MNDLTLANFKDLNNLKSIELFRWGLSVDLIVNEKINDDDVGLLVTYLKSSEHVLSTGYKGKDFIRVQLKYSFYDEVVNKTLVIDDFFKDYTLIEEYSLTIKILNFTPIGSITFVLEKEGRKYAKQMIEDLKNLKYPFLKSKQYFE